MKKVLDMFPESARVRKIVAAEFLRLGLKVDGSGRILIGNIEIPPAKIGRALGVDRRVVIDTAKLIVDNDKLLPIFYNMESRAFISNIAKELDFDTIEIRADPNRIGIVAIVSKILADEKVAIRQIISDDPDLFPDPVLTVIINGKVNAKIINRLKKSEVAESILIK